VGAKGCKIVFLGRGTSYSIAQTLLLQDVSSSNNAQRHSQTGGRIDDMHAAVRSAKKSGPQRPVIPYVF